MATSYDLVSMKTSALNAIQEFSKRKLIHSAKWLSEIVFALKDVKLNVNVKITCDGISKQEYDKYLLAGSYFKNQEYDRCGFYLKDTSSPVCRFLRYYALYMSLEYKKICSTTDANLFSSTPDGPYLRNMQNLCNGLKIAYINDQLDGYCLYVYGIVLKKLNHFDDAKDILIEAINKEPMNWAAWQELTPLIAEKQLIDSLMLPDHWMKDFFLANLLVDLHLYKEAEEAYKIMLNNGLQSSQYILGQIAVCQYTRKDMESALNIYNQMRKMDPFRLEGMETFSDLLFVAETKKALSFLAHSVTEIDKYRVETSCVVGNYYSMRGERTKSILSFQRAVKMNPSYAAAWTFMGHEYNELKNTSAAILCYQKAIEMNKRDYRAWYSLGQAYESYYSSLQNSSLPSLLWLAVYYFKVAQKLRPQDNRMLLALGETYERISRYEEAYKCYQQARNVDKCDPLAMIKMGKLLERLNENELAASAYSELADDKTDIHSVLPYKQEFTTACMFLAKHFAARKELDQAKHFANQLGRHPEFADAYEKTMQIIAPKKKDAAAPTAEGETRRGRPSPMLNLEESIRQLFPW